MSQAQGDTSKIPIFHVMLYKKEYNENNEKAASKYDENVSVVKFQDDDKTEEEQKQDNRRIKRSIDKELRRELKLDSI